MSSETVRSDEFHPLDEVKRPARSLDDGMYLRLRAAARSLSRGLDTVRDDPAGLVAEAVQRTLEGKRRWRKGVDFEVHLFHVMKSAVDQRRRRGGKVSKAGAGELRETQRWPSAEGSVIDQRTLAPPNRSPEAKLLVNERLQAIWRHFHDDPAATGVLRCWRLGMTGPETCEQIGMSRREYVTTAERIRRFARRGGERHAR